MCNNIVNPKNNVILNNIISRPNNHNLLPIVTRGSNCCAAFHNNKQPTANRREWGNKSIDKPCDATGKHTPDIFGQSTEDDDVKINGG